MSYVDVLNRKVFEKARKMPDIMPEMFTVLEEYDRTTILRRWGNKVRVNFTMDPVVIGELRRYCDKNGFKMSTLVERLIKEKVK